MTGWLGLDAIDVMAYLRLIWRDHKHKGAPGRLVSNKYFTEKRSSRVTENHRSLRRRQDAAETNIKEGCLISTWPWSHRMSI